MFCSQKSASKPKYLYSNVTSIRIKVIFMEFKKVNITLPAQLLEKSRQLIDRGLYSNFSDLVRSSLRREIKEEQDLLKQSDEWKDLVESIRNDLKKSDLEGLSEQEIIKRLRRTRDKIWEEQYA